MARIPSSLALAGVLAASALLAGCGSNDPVENAVVVPPVAVAPTPTPTPG